MHAALGARQLVLDGGAAGGGRGGVGHLEHGRDAAQDRRQASAGQVFLVAVARLAEVHLGVHHPGQNMQAPGLEHLCGPGVREGTDGGNAPGYDPHVGRGNAIGGGNRSAPDQQIETFHHR